MKLGVWITLLMVVLGIFAYYSSEPLMLMMPQDKDGNIAREYSTIPVLLDIGGLGLMFFGFLYASYYCETALIKHNKQTQDVIKRGKEKCQQLKHSQWPQSLCS